MALYKGEMEVDESLKNRNHEESPRCEYLEFSNWRSAVCGEYAPSGSLAGGRRTRGSIPSTIYLAYAGALVLAVGLLLLGIGLIRKTH
jgi:hypothetical protein